MRQDRASLPVPSPAKLGEATTRQRTQQTSCPGIGLAYLVKHVEKCVDQVSLLPVRLIWLTAVLSISLCQGEKPAVIWA
jgi:hypothetical protein